MYTAPKYAILYSDKLFAEKVNNMKKYLGVDIGGTAVKLGIVDEKGNVLEKTDYDVAFDNYETAIIDTVEKGIAEFAGDRLSELSGIGVSATGQIDTKNGVVIGGCGYIPKWEGSPIKERFEAKFGLTTTVLNDATAVAVGEQWCGAATGIDNVVVMTIGTGVGGGIITDSRVLMGVRGLGGEIGHFTIKYDGIPCTCGNNGCFEKYASMTALANTVKADKALLNEISLSESEVNGRTIFEHLDNEKIAKYVDDWMNCISAGLVGLVHIFNPEVIIIGGGISNEDELFIKPLRKKIISHAMPRLGEQLKVKAAKLGNKAGMVGAVAYFISSQK